MLKFNKFALYCPDPAPAKPLITEEQRMRAAATPPEIVPFHCKPWLDGQNIGYTLFYGFITPITISNNGGELVVGNLEQLKKEFGGKSPLDQFDRTHFLIDPGLVLKTAPGQVCLIIPANNPPALLQPLTAVIETDWYPNPIFLVFRLPEEGQVIHLDYRAELVRVVVTPRPQRTAALPMDEADLLMYDRQHAQYKAEKKATTSRWRDGKGRVRTQMYHTWSRRYVSEQSTVDSEP
ncbi:MAG: hypothetical protein KA314_26915 [Chloroflexi bacterium]|nr:hypothetical protein [Chloroflexota bacterium]MBP8059484.1 hypothetical protein [Chloroflexota bacterium]